MPQWRFVSKTGQTQNQEPISWGDGTEPVWYPLLPFGRYVTPNNEYFEITPEYTDEMIAQFREGLPNALGVPGDENQLHGKHELGAFAWAKDLENREDGLWGALQPTQEGLKYADSLPYVSPHFTVGDAIDPNYGRKNFLAAFAMCSSPWFYGQPGLTLEPGATVAASMSNGAAPAAPETEIENQTVGGGHMTAEEFQAKIEELETALTTANETVTTLTAEKETLTTDLAAKDERITELETAQTESEGKVTDLTTRLEALEAAAKEAETERAMEAKVNELATEVLTLGDEQVVRTREGAEVMASMLLNPCPETAQAFQAHIAAHGGNVATEPIADKPNLQPFKASMHGRDGDGNLTDEQKLEALPDDRARRIRSIMEADRIGFEAARRKDFDSRH